MTPKPPSRRLRNKLTEAGAMLGFALFFAAPWLVMSCGSDSTSTASTIGDSADSNQSTTTGSTTGSTTTSGTSSKAACTTQTAPTCTNPNAGPSYNDTVANLIYGYCLQCHDPNGVANISGSSHAFTPPSGGYGSFDPNDANNTMGDGNTMAGNGNAMAGNGNAGPDSHGMGGNANRADWDPRAEYDWSNYGNIRRHAQDMITVLINCVMPPSNATSLSDADRTTLLQWLACGAQDN